MTTMSAPAAEVKAPPPKDDGRKNGLFQGWLVILLAVVFGGLLAAVELTLGPAIAANKRNETLSRIPELISVPAADSQKLDIQPLAIPVTRDGKTTTYRVYRADRDKHPAGWVIQATGQGYADRIEILLGLSPDAASITGLFVLEQKETPGLGNKIASIPWRSQFNGKPTGQALEVIKGGATQASQIDAITGATISSRSVAAIVNRVTADLRDRLAAEAGKEAS